MKTIMKTMLSLLLLICFSQVIKAQTTNFEGIPYSSGQHAADPVIAVGNSYIVEAVNQQIAVYDKAGNLVSQQSFSDFFANQSPPSDIFDPQLAYDQYSDRFIFLAAAHDVYSNSKYMLAVSQSSDPTSGWYRYKLNAVDSQYPSYHMDFPALGYDEQALYLTTNMLGGTIYYYPKITILKKSEVYSGTQNFRNDLIDFHASDGTQPKNLKPMRKFGTSSGYYLVNNLNQGAGKIRIWSLQNPLSANPSVSDVATKTLGNYSAINDATQKGSSNTIDMDGAQVSNVISYDGYLYGAYTARNTQANGSMIVYFKVDSGNNYNVLTNGKIETSNKFYYYPSLQPDNNGNIAFVFNKSSADDYVGVAWTILYSGDQTVGPIEWLKEGVAPYYNPLGGNNRWGDYSGIALDPSNNQRIWICGEWADNNNQWGTQIGEINTSPTRNVVVDQKLNNGTRVGYVKKWNGSSWGTAYSPPKTFSFPVTSTQTILGDQAIYSSQKYNNWTRNGSVEPDILNYHAFSVGYNDNNYTSHFIPTYSGVTIHNSIDGTAAGGTVYFKDPWFIDHSDPNYGSQKRNEGMSAPFISRTSPFSPDYSTSYGGDTYKGLFLNQNPRFDSTQPIYSVRAPLTQTITVNGQNHTAYFQNWSTSGAQTQQIGSNPNGYDQKAVVFTGSNATVTANYKGSLISDNAGAWNTNQRKIVRSANGWQHLVYASMGHIWYEIKAPGGTWQLADANGTQPHQDPGGGRAPALDYLEWPTGTPRTALVWQQGDQIRLQTFYYDGSTYQYGPAKTYASGESSSYSATPNVAWARVTRISHQEIFPSARRS